MVFNIQIYHQNSDYVKLPDLPSVYLHKTFEKEIFTYKFSLILMICFLKSDH